ncbi:hypothetical protein GYA28_00520 [Candidatus Roizmanbacteria bacterium]|jgi:type II secretory pathway pseudopilin PulG|nr:hypothetical protein [Candidatus Roizmanbacteria bacterium]
MGIKPYLKRSFTLIESLVVVGVIGLVLPAIFSITFIIIQQQTKIIRLQEVKKQGDFVINTVENLIRNNAVSIHSTYPFTDDNEICDNPAVGAAEEAAYFKDKFGQRFRFFVPAGTTKVASESADGSSIDLTNSDIRVEPATFKIRCYKPSAYSSSIVEISFNICYAVGSSCTSSRPEETATLDYQTKVVLKEY